ncbi:MAG: FAD-dependent oxidoreductase [Chloroflexota bacterium]
MPDQNSPETGMRTNRQPSTGIIIQVLPFIPWAVYWYLSSPDGILVALGLCFALLAHQTWTQSFRIMDLVSLTYFLAAAVSTFVQSATLFIDSAGELSLTTLFSMAVVSVLIRRPFSSDAARCDYPRHYWRNPTFISVHSIVSVVWAGVFFLAGVTVWFSALTIVSVPVIALFIVGLVFDAIFQAKGAAFLIRQQYRPYEWHIPLTPTRSKQQNEFDVAVVGAGIGGLTTAALLSEHGYKVLVMEQQAQVGGYCGSLMRDDFIFSMGLSGISGAWENGPLTRLLSELGVPVDGRFTQNSIRHIYKGHVVEMPSGVSKLVASLGDVFPEERDGIASFYQEAAEAYFQLYQYSGHHGVPLPDHLTVQLLGDRAVARLPKAYPALYGWLGKTFQQKLDEHLSSDNLKSLLSTGAGQNGTPAASTPGLRALLGTMGQYLAGSHFPVGGPRAYATTLAEVVEQNGGTVLPNYKVDRILTDRRQVRGVRSGAEIFQAGVVVANVNARACVLQLLEASEVGGPYIDFIKSLQMSQSAFIVYAGVEQDLSSLPSIIRHIDGDFTIFINSNVDHRMAPRGRSSLTIVAPVGYREFPSREARDYDDRKRQFAALLIRKAEEVIPGLSSNVRTLDAASPRTLESYTAMPEGALYGFSQATGTRRPHFRALIKGLYFVGASTFPGAGLESVTISGIICANDIQGWRLPGSGE